jgi:phospholipase C
VCSETFDHTSLIRFMETRFGVVEPNITRWRRTVCGDLTSAFDFSRTPSPPPTLGVDTSGYAPPDNTRHPSYFPTPPAEQTLPVQEVGTRPARPLHYRLAVDVQVRDRSLRFDLRNTGGLGAHLQARSGNVKGAPFSYTLDAGTSIEPSLEVSGPYDVTFHGPHGFFRRFSGTTKQPLLRVKGRKKDDALVLTLVNLSKKPLKVHIANVYGPDRTVKVRRRKRRVSVPLASRWYDVLVTVAGHPSYRRALAGHFDNGRPSISDPRLGG